MVCSPQVNSIYFAPAAAIVVTDFVRFSVSKAHPCCEFRDSEIGRTVIAKVMEPYHEYLAARSTKS